jgi:hypothetical protein
MLLVWAQNGFTGHTRHCARTIAALPQPELLHSSTTAVYHEKGEQQRMSDTVLVAMVTGIPGIVASILRYVDRRDIRRAVALGEKAATLGAKNEQHLAETKTAMAELAENTNSIKDELVKTTAIASRALGNKEGRAELKQETNAESEEHF